MTTVFILSGFILGENASTITEFDDFENLLRKKGYEVVRVAIDYDKHTHTTYIAEFLDKYSTLKTEQNIVIGNSFGAVVALFSAPDFLPTELYLCSMSPFFAETLADERYYDYAMQEFGKDRADDLKAYSTIEIAHKINQLNIPVHFTYGEFETGIYDHLVDFNKAYQQSFISSDIVMIPNAPHGMRDPSYYHAIAELL